MRHLLSLLESFSTHLLIQTLLLLTAFGFHASCQAEGVPSVYFSGVAYTSDSSEISATYPHIFNELQGDGVRRFDERLHALVSKAGGLPENIHFNTLGSLSQSSTATALALAIDDEILSVERIGDIYKLRVEVSAEALFFDFKARQVLGGVPFTLDLIDIYPAPPSAEQIQSTFHQLLFGTANGHDLGSEFVQVLQKNRLPSPASKRLRVAHATISPRAMTSLKQANPDVDPSILNQQMANAFGKYLSDNQHIAVLPYRSNQALGGAMPARFAEGSAYNLKIPDADYEINIDLAGFKKIEAAHTAIDTLFIYGAFADIDVREPLSGKEYFHQRIKQGESKTIPITQQTVDDWAAMRDTLMNLFNNFTLSISDPNSPWIKTGMTNDSPARQQLASLSSLVASCR